MEIVRLPAFNDNYIFLLCDRQKGEAIAVDPGDGNVVWQYLQREGLTLTAIFITHHHHDHVGGNRFLLAHYSNIPVYASAVDQQKRRIPEQTVGLKAGDRLTHTTLSDRAAEILFIPGHTQGHIAYYFPPEQSAEQGDLFCGDTLFANGCGRLLEGNPQQMLRSLQQIRDLPDATNIWCAHEYTLQNIRFSLSVNPENQALQRRSQEVFAQRQRGEATIPSLLTIEKQTNPFLRWDDPQIQCNLHQNDPLRVFTKLRGKRDLF